MELLQEHLYFKRFSLADVIIVRKTTLKFQPALIDKVSAYRNVCEWGSEIGRYLTDNLGNRPVIHDVLSILHMECQNKDGEKPCPPICGAMMK